MSYHHRHHRARRAATGLGDLASAISTAADVVKDPYLQELLCRVKQLKAINDHEAVPVCATTAPNLAGGVGLRKVMPALRGYVYAEQRTWPYALAAVGFIGVPLFIGYQLGKRKRSL